MLLSELSVGHCATVTALNPRLPIRRRLQDIGFIPGTRVKCVGKSPLGDPSAYAIRGAVIALRRNDADGIEIERGNA